MHKVMDVKVMPEYKLLLRFDDGSKKEFDMKPYLNVGLYSTLQDENIFKTAHIAFDTVEWSNGVDIDPEFLYANAKELNAV